MTRLPGRLAGCKQRCALWTVPAWGSVRAHVTCDTCRRLWWGEGWTVPALEAAESGASSLAAFNADTSCQR